MHVKRIDHINLRTPLLEETVTFYEQLLGLKRGPLPGIDETRNAWLYDMAGQPIIHINMPPEGDAVLQDRDSGRIHHVALDCTDYEGLATKLVDMGLPYHSNHMESFGLRQVFVHDPNGVLLELNFRTQP